MTNEALVRVERGRPTDEELAAIITVLNEHYAQESAVATVAESRTDRWTHSRRMRDTRRREWGRFAG